MRPINIILVSSCLSTLVIGQEHHFPYPGQHSYFDENSSYTYYFRYQGHDPASIPQVCQDKKSVVCVVKNETLVINNAGQLDAVSKEDADDSDRFSLIFEDGEHCDKTGSTARKYKTRIDYFCPDERSDYEAPVVLIKGGDPCLIKFFVWQQTEKCRHSQTGSNCVIDLPSYSTRLDLKVLKSQVYDVNDQFQINICGGIESSTKCPKGVGLCGPKGVIIKAGFQILTRYDYNSGKVKVDYVGKDGSNASITLDCDRNEDVKFEFIGKDHIEGHDNYKFNVRTKHVCLSKPQNCQYLDKKSQKFYDLNGLRNTYNEWVTSDKHRTYHLSVCKPLSPASAESNCPGDKSSICAENSETKESIVIATTSDSIEPKFQSNDDLLILTYDQGARCNANNNYSAQILFRCDRENSGRGPVIMDILDNCTYIFEWKTVHACPQVTEESHNCKVKDNFYGHTFDLSPLHQAEKDLQIGNFTLNICGRSGLLTKSCGLDVSICYEDKPIGLKTSEKLIFADGELHLEYEGEPCTDTIKYNTNIMFVCDHDIGIGKPQLGISDDCHFVFTWKTVHACPPHDEIDCRVKDENGEIFDFSDLALSDSNYQIPMRNSNEMIVLNACKSLVHSTMSRCPYKSAVCLRKENADGSFSFANLGEAKKSPFLDEYNRLVLEYPNGGLCKEKDTQETHISTRIIFK